MRAANAAGKDELHTHWRGIFEAIEQMAFFTQLASIAVDGDRPQSVRTAWRS